MRVAVVGAGVAGALLAHRLAAAGAAVAVHAGPGPDATAVSGGLTRAFEPDPVTGRLAAASLAELHADPALAAAAGFVETGSVYVLPSAAGLGPLPAGARLERPDPAWRGLPAAAVAVVEDRAGHLAPDRLRCWALAGLAVSGPAADPVGLAGYDAVVLATGRWTPRILAAAGLPGPYRTKAIQYGLYPSDWVPPAYVDGISGLWARPAGPGSVLAGVPSDRWDPERLEPDPALVDRTAAAVRERFGVSLGPPATVVASADAYADPPVLALRPVGGRPGLFTFTGGSGGAAKYALAASREAAAALLGLG